VEDTAGKGATSALCLVRDIGIVREGLNNLFTAFIEGAALVILVVVVFLMNRASRGYHPAGTAVSLEAAVITLDRFGLTINTMSLGRLAIAIGELVEDAIIDIENVVRRLRENAAGNPSRSGGSGNLHPVPTGTRSPLSE
jgi:heavy-metal exporter, HME family